MAGDKSAKWLTLWQDCDILMPRGNLNDFCKVGFSVITDSAINSIGLGVNPLLEQLFNIR